MCMTATMTIATTLFHYHHTCFWPLTHFWGLNMQPTQTVMPTPTRMGTRSGGGAGEGNLIYYESFYQYLISPSS